MPVGQMILVRAAGPKNLARVMSAIGVPMILAPVLGPTLGGLLIEHAGWQWIFFVNIPIGAVAVVAALRLLPREPPETAGPLDALGFVLAGRGRRRRHVRAGGERPHREPRRPERPRAADDRPRAHRGLRRARAAHRAPAARHAPLRQPRVQRRRADDVRARRRAVRRDDPHAAVLPDRPRRQRRGDGPAADPPGHRRGAGDALRRAGDRALRRRAHGARRHRRDAGRHDPVHADHRGHAVRAHQRGDVRPRLRSRPVHDARVDRGVRGAAPRSGQRRHPAADGRAARGRVDRDGGPHGHPAGPPRRGGPVGERAGRRVRRHLPVGDRHLAAGDRADDPPYARRTARRPRRARGDRAGAHGRGGRR